MRRLFGVLIFAVAATFLGLAYAQLARAGVCEVKGDEIPTCDSALAKKLVELIKADQSNVLDVQFDIAVLKLARDALGSNSPTAEAHIRQQEEVLKKLENVEANKDIRKKVAVLYQKHGMLADLEKIEAGLDRADDLATPESKTKAIAYRKKMSGKALNDFAEKAKGANYYRISKAGDKTRDLRFRNRDLSAYVLAHTLVKGDRTYDANDASILWFKAQLSEGLEAEHGRGSERANLEEASTKVAHLLGVAGKKTATKEELDAAIDLAEKALTDAFDKVQEKYADELKKSCKEMETCETCAVTAEENRILDGTRKSALNQAMVAIGRNAKICERKLDDAKKEATKDLNEGSVDLSLEEGGGTSPSPTPSPTPIVEVSPLAEVVVTAKVSKEQAANNKALRERIAKGGKDAMPWDGASEAEKKKYNPETLGACTATYTFEGKTVNFWVVKDGKFIVCSGTYEVAKVVADAKNVRGAWYADKVREICKTGEKQIAVGAFCPVPDEEDEAEGDGSGEETKE